MTTLLSHYVRRAGDEHTRNFAGTRLTFLADAGHTGGSYSIMDVLVRPGLEPPPHVHTHEDEAYYVLQGSWTFRCGDATSDGEPGTWVFLPRGLMHSFTLSGEGRALVIISPAGLEDVFHELSEPMPPGTELPPAPTGPPPIERAKALFGRHDVRFPPPGG
jgi:quercetin dioxygenase-like cupin family protein